jgi:hypothetical protein
MNKLHTSFKVALAMVLATIIAMGAASTVYGEIIGSYGVADTPPVIVVQSATPNITAAVGSVITYQVAVQTQRSRGIGTATVNFTFDPVNIRILDAQFSNKDAWVKELQPGLLQFETGKITQGMPVVATIRAQVVEYAPMGLALTSGVGFEWADEWGERSRDYGNQLNITVAETDSHQENYTLFVDPPVAPTGTHRMFATDAIFAPGEEVTIWYDYLDWGSIEVGRIPADSNGRVQFEFGTWSLGTGMYKMVVHGNWTGFEAVTMFEVGTPPPPPAPDPTPMPVVQPDQSQNAPAPGCPQCHQKHNVKASHPHNPNCTTCHGDSKPPLELGCVECHSKPPHQAVVQMPHPEHPAQTDEPCVQCHGGM